MKRFYRLFAVVMVLIATNSFGSIRGGVGVPKTTTLYALDGKSDLKLEDNDSITVLHIFASWCPYCKNEHVLWEGVNKIEGIKYYAVTYREYAEKGKIFLKNRVNPFDRHFILDVENARNLQVHTVPDTLVMYKNKILLRNKGSIKKGKFERFTNEKLLNLKQQIYG